MPTDVIMPQMGESIFEGTITKWLKKTGDPVEKDEPLFEISTDKVDAEIPSPVAGVLSEIKFPEGATVQVNAVVAVLSENGAASATREKRQGTAAPQVPQATAADLAPKAQVPPPQVPGGTEIVMPQMGESIFEGTITKWLKKVGDQVQKDEPLFEISTDKVDAEIPAPIDGILTEIKFGEGETVQVNQVVAVIGGLAPSSSSAQTKSSQPAASVQTKPAQPFIARSETQLEPPVASTGQTLRSSPLVRRIAREHNIDLARVPGTGSQGRITKDDIVGYLSVPAAQRPLAPTQVPPKAESIAPEVPAKPRLATPQVPLKDEIVPLSKMRAIIAERMAESKRTIPHAHTVYKVDMTRVVRLRDRERAAFEQRHGVKLTYMPFIAVAAIEALRKFPILNASLEGTSIHYHGNIHLGLAVALEWGLIVPVIRAAERPRLPLHRTRHPGSRRPRAHQEASARRSGRIDLHAHQCRRLWRRIRHAHHQSTRIRHSRDRRPAQRTCRADRRRRQRHHRHSLHAVLLPGHRSPPDRRRRRRQVHDGVQAHPRKLGSPHRLIHQARALSDTLPKTPRFPSRPQPNHDAVHTGAIRPHNQCASRCDCARPRAHRALHDAALHRLVSRSRQHQLCQTSHAGFGRHLGTNLCSRRRAVLRQLFALRVPQQSHPAQNWREALALIPTHRLGTGVDGDHVRHGQHLVLCPAHSARHPRGRLLSGRCPVSHLLVSRTCARRDHGPLLSRCPHLAHRWRAALGPAA